MVAQVRADGAGGRTAGAGGTWPSPPARASPAAPAHPRPGPAGRSEASSPPCSRGRRRGHAGAARARVRMGTQGSPVKSYDYLLKFLLVGDSDVGKGEILESLQDGAAESPYAYSNGKAVARAALRAASRPAAARGMFSFSALCPPAKARAPGWGAGSNWIQSSQYAWPWPGQMEAFSEANGFAVDPWVHQSRAAWWLWARAIPAPE